MSRAGGQEILYARLTNHWEAIALQNRVRSEEFRPIAIASSNLMLPRFLGFFSLLGSSSIIRYSPFSSISNSPLASPHLQNPLQNSPIPLRQIDERFVLQELSDLLQIDARTSNNPLANNTDIPNHHQSNGGSAERRIASNDLLQVDSRTSNYRRFAEASSRLSVESRQVDCFLSPAEKLRGIFLQKLKGKAMVESALSAAGVDLSVVIMAEVVNRGNLGGEAMVSFFNWAIKQPNMAKDLETFHVVLKALGRRKFFHHMEEVLCRMKKEGLELDGETILIVMDSYTRARQIAKAIQFFERLSEFGKDCDCESLNVLLKCLCYRSHVGAADSFLNSMKGKVTFNRTTYNTVIGGWAKSGRVGEVEKNSKLMIADGLEPDCLTFGYLLEALGRAGRVHDAVAVFKKIEESGHGIVTYNAMIFNFISVGNLDECIKYYKCMLQENIPPDLDTYSRLISAFIKARRVSDALEMLDEMLGRGIHPSTGTITSFVEPLCNFGPPYAAMMIYKRAKKAGIIVSLKAYKLLLMRLSRFGKSGMVLKVWEEMQDSGYFSDMEVYEYVINGLCNIGQLEKAALVMEDAMHKGFCPSKLIFSKLNNKLLNANKVERAYKLFLKFKKVQCSDNTRKHWRANVTCSLNLPAQKVDYIGLSIYVPLGCGTFYEFEKLGYDGEVTLYGLRWYKDKRTLAK
ncbi:hypothetical protein ACLOJK_018420 [Asimina triloba]